LIATLANSTVVTEANKEHLLDQLLGFKPVVDGSIVPNNFMELLESSKLNPNAQIIVGTTADEAAVFAYQIEKPPAITMTQYSLATIAIFGANKGAKLGYYYSRFFTDGFAALSRTVTDMWFRCSMQKFVTVQQKLSGKQAYVYRYTHVFESPDVFDYFEFPKECRTQVRVIISAKSPSLCSLPSIQALFHRFLDNLNTFSFCQFLLIPSLVHLFLLHCLCVFRCAMPPSCPSCSTSRSRRTPRSRSR